MDAVVGIFTVDLRHRLSRFRKARLATFILALITAGPMLAQNAELSGLVGDPSGLTAGRHANRSGELSKPGVSSSVLSNQQGEYSVPALLPGAYNLTVEATGFKPFTRLRVVVEVAQRARVDFALTIGGNSETITVEGSAPLLFFFFWPRPSFPSFASIEDTTTSDQIWLWARGYDGGGPYLDLLRRMAHWLMKEPELEEEALRASARGRTITVERQSVSGEARDTTLTGPDGAKIRLAFKPVAPGLSRAQATVDRFGLYRAEDGEHVALVEVGPGNPLEMRDVVSTPEKLAPLAEATGGSARRLSASEADDVNVPRIVGLNPAPSYAGGDYIGIKRTGSTELIGARSTSLASGFFGLALLLGAIVAAWLSESGRFGRKGGGRAGT